MTKQEALERIESFSQLKENWDSYDADPISPLATETAKLLIELIDINIPYVFPTVTGGIQFEWDDQEHLDDIEITYEGKCIIDSNEDN